MTNINCSSDCIYQKEGKCSFDHVYNSKITPNEKCAYYSAKKENENKE